MKKETITLALILVTAMSGFATDTVKVFNPALPILIDRTDNELFYLRVETSQRRTLNQVTVSFDRSVNLTEIKTLRLYYGGVECVQRHGQIHPSPVSYLSRDTPGRTRQANRSYSIERSAVKPSGSTVTLCADQPLSPGVNYFWVSIEMLPGASLLSKIKTSVDAVTIDQQATTIDRVTDTPCRYLGMGVRHAGDNGACAYRIPGLVTTNDGTLLAVYDIRVNSSVDLQEEVEVGLSRSTDKGQTWEPMRSILSFGEEGGLPKAQNGVGDPAILVDRTTGTVWVVAAWTHGMGNGRAWFNSQEGMDRQRTAQLVLTKSTDDGQTWSSPMNITGQVKQPSWRFLLQGPGMGISTKDGTLVFACQHIDSIGTPHAGILYSRDHGQSWHIHRPARENTTEAQVAEVEPGLLMLNMRDNRGGSRAVSVTRDLGKSWVEHPSSRSVLQEPVCMASLIRVDARDNILERDLLLFSNPNTTQGRHHITLKASLDGGNSFPYELLLDSDEGWGYSCLTMVDPETVGILYEGSGAHMVYQRIRLTDLIEKLF